MTAVPVEVADWTKEAKSFRPTMTAEVGAPPETALAAMAAGLSSQGYRIKDRTDTGFRASHRKLIQGILGLLTASDADIIERTLLGVTATSAGPGTRLTVSVLGGGQLGAGIRRGTAGLSTGLQDLQRRGFPVVASPWQKR